MFKGRTHVKGHEIVLTYLNVVEQMKDLQLSIRHLRGDKSPGDTWLEAAKKDERSSVKLLVAEYTKVEEQLRELYQIEFVITNNEDEKRLE